MSSHSTDSVVPSCQLRQGYCFGGHVENILKRKLNSQELSLAHNTINLQNVSQGKQTCDIERMKLALIESMKAVGASSPNPAVGCYVFKGNQFLFGSHTQQYGGLHAERSALQLQGLSAFPEECEVYVTLEPCSHHGKTPPCADLFAASKNIRVIIASEDPNPLVAGRGIEKIKSTGLELSIGCLRTEARATLLPFLKAVTKKEPFIGLKWAQSVDGKLADFRGASKWLTGEALKSYTFWLRQKYDCIAVGLGTLEADNPELNVRAFEDEIVIRNPLRIVLDPRGKFLAMTRVEQTRLLNCKNPNNTRPWIVVSGKPTQNSASGLEFQDLKEHLLVTVGQENFIERFKEFLKSHEMQQRNGSKQIQSLLVEGGATVHSMFLSQRLYDILHVYQAPLILGGTVHTVSKQAQVSSFPQNLATAPRLHLMQSFSAGPDTVTEYLSDETAELLRG